MKADRPSATALRVALARAAHQTVDGLPRVLDDPIAVRIIGNDEAQRMHASSARSRSIFGRRMRAFVLARSRVAEDELANAWARGVRQYVVLGAGLDTYAFRNAGASQQLRVFEVDHPATQAWKRRLLVQAGIAVPSSVSFVAVDFERQSWREALLQAGLRPDLPTHFSWLGVSMYLTPQDVCATVADIASMPAGTSLVFDYLIPPSQLGPGLRIVLGVLSAVVSLAGEPLKSHFAPDEIRQRLAQAGFSDVEDLGPDALNARFFSGRTDALAVGSMGRIVCARV